MSPLLLTILSIGSPFALVAFGLGLYHCVQGTSLETELSRRRERDRAAARRARHSRQAPRHRGKFKLSQDGKGGRSANS